MKKTLAILRFYGLQDAGIIDAGQGYGLLGQLKMCGKQYPV